jgi:hypothetical protein
MPFVSNAVLTNTKTVAVDVSPSLKASTLTGLLAIAPENLTVAQFNQLADAIKRIPGGGDNASVIGALLR